MEANESAVQAADEKLAPARGVLSRLSENPIMRTARGAAGAAMLLAMPQSVNADPPEKIPATPVSSAKPESTLPPPPTPEKISILVHQWGSDEHEKRHNATLFLQQHAGVLDAEARKILEQAGKSNDMEVRLRALDILKQAKTADIWKPSRVTLERCEWKASDVIPEIGRQTGNRLLIGDEYGTFQDGMVRLPKEGTFWELLDEVCRQSGNHVRSHYDTRNPGLVVVSGGPGKYPTAYAGPFRVRVLSARRVFVEELDYDELKSEQTHTFQINLQFMWEDRFRLVAYRSQPELTEAQGSDNQPILSAQPAGAGWNVASQGTHQLSTDLRFHPPCTNAKGLDVLKLRWGAIAVGDMRTIHVNDLSVDTPHMQDDATLKIEEIQEAPGARFEVKLHIARDLVIPEPQEVLYNENEVELLDQEGIPFRKQGQTNSLTNEGVRLKLNFTGENATSRPKSLRFTYPAVRDRRDIDIEYKNSFPLPTGKPK